MKLAVVATLLSLVVAALLFWLWTPDRSRASLEATYLNAPGDMLDVAGLRLHVRDSGPKAAPAVILLHGFGASLHTWEPWTQGLQTDRRAIRFDLPGSGLSTPDPTGDYSDARSLQVLVALMDTLGVARASVKLMRYALPKPLLRMSLAPAYANPATMTDALATRYHDLMLAPGSRDALIARMEQTVLTDPAPLLKRIRAPTLLLWGEQDGMIPFANSADYMKVVPHITQVSLKGVGHVPHEEAAEASLVPVAAFLRGP